jgi:hypothetical protein
MIYGTRPSQRIDTWPERGVTLTVTAGWFRRLRLARFAARGVDQQSPCVGDRRFGQVGQLTGNPLHAGPGLVPVRRGAGPRLRRNPVRFAAADSRSVWHPSSGPRRQRGSASPNCRSRAPPNHVSGRVLRRTSSRNHCRWGAWPWLFEAALARTCLDLMRTAALC